MLCEQRYGVLPSTCVSSVIVAFVWSLGYARYLHGGAGKKTKKWEKPVPSRHSLLSTHKLITDKYLLHFLLGSHGEIPNDG